MANSFDELTFIFLDSQFYFETQFKWDVCSFPFDIRNRNDDDVVYVPIDDYYGQLHR